MCNLDTDTTGELNCLKGALVLASKISGHRQFAQVNENREDQQRILTTTTVA